MDIKLTLTCVLIAGGLIGLVLPGGNGQLDSGEGAAGEGSAANAVFTPEAHVAAAQEPVDSAWTENVVLERQTDGHFYADVRVDGREFNMLVDTGATVVALTAEDALAMGLQWYEDEVHPVAQGAGGPINGVNATIQRMSLGNHEATGVRAIIIPEGAGISLLGQSFLSTIGTVEIAGDRMVLGN